MSELWVNSWVPSACAWTSWQKNSKKGNRREQEGTRMGPGGIGMCRSNQNVWLSGSWVLHSLSQVKQFCHLVYFSSSQKPSEGWRWAVVICGTTNSFSRGNKFLFCDISFKKYLILYSRRNESDRISKCFFYLEPDRASTRVVTWYMGSGLKAQNLTGIRAQRKGLRAQKNGIRDHKAFEPESEIRFITRSKNILSQYIVFPRNKVCVQ